MKAESFWPLAPRVNFSAQCVARFGMSFDGGPIKPPMQEPKIPAGRPMQRAYPMTADALSLQSKVKSKGGHRAGTSISTRAMKHGQRLVG